MSISVLLVDDSEIFHEGVCTLLQIYPNINLIVETNNGEDALIIAADLHPDMVILDWHMPGYRGVDMMRLLLDQYPKIKVIILSMCTDGAYVESAVQRGVSGYVLKNEIAFHLAKAIHAVAEGHKYFSPSLQLDMSDSVSQGDALV